MKEGLVICRKATSILYYCPTRHIVQNVHEFMHTRTRAETVGKNFSYFVEILSTFRFQ